MKPEFSQYENNLVKKAIRRQKLFLVLSIISVVIAFALGAFYTWEAFNQKGFNKSVHFIVVILILLNARQNLRQYNYAKVLEKLTCSSQK